MSETIDLFTIPETDKARLRILFLAKHAAAGGALHGEDGNHAVYHHEVLTTLREIGLNVTPQSDFSALYDKTDFDFVFTLLNRAGFPMSEMLGPLLAQRIGLPALGASPILRGLSDDKHLMKTVAVARGVPVAPWLIARRGCLYIPYPDFAFERLVVKPNASSASWGVTMPTDWDRALRDIAKLHAEGHDVIVERYEGAYDVVVPVLGGDDPILLSTMRFEMPGDEGNFRSYEEKRGLSEGPKERLVAMRNPVMTRKIREFTRAMLPELWPFDYGRFEFRYTPTTGEVLFMEVNLSCNLWSKKTVSGAAQLAGLTHPQLLEHIAAYSMDRQGVIKAERTPFAPTVMPEEVGGETIEV
ncbi:D-alanine--D-alanine ligase family protein [Qipengyuania flava]|uniref:phosphoribosylglycinamide synthetase n=1 Tax=Qipengyuania flava TaxID=192812 RepID=UPI001C564CF1|nr:phosphoribosylglycinamide synthetase [Qipengyuania flava]MBW3168509.1 phosphoribosylglycinamide synthetase [Qipengyuania flava]MBY5965747.1 phosphoribosylglycinamide synthetase [Qipengyuania flava]MBY6012071.1 phosphoribosylglycinamide synthetase [Qipengyuania flava]MBY6026513.1 phosphoribosylglycinamide synthetase [Qipengyuania flava]